jgi:hypothetical protein
MPIPSVSANVATNHNWLSSMDATTSVLKPEISPELTRRYGDQNMTGLIEEMGGMNPVSQIVYTHFEEDFLHTIIKVDQQGGGGAGASVTLTVAAAYQYSFPATAQSPYIVTGAQNTMPPLNGMIVKIGSIHAVVTGANYAAGTFVVTPQISGESIPATTTSTEIIIVGNQHAEGSGQPGSRNSRTNRYTNNLQISKWDNTTTGTAMGERLWFEVPGPNGQMGYLWMFKAQLDEFRRARNEREVTAIVGKKTTNTTFANLSDQSTNVSTEGMIPFVENFGNTTTYNLVPGITLTDFEGMITNQLDKNRGAKENGIILGIKLRSSIESFIRDTMKNGAITYGQFSGNKQKYIDFGFDSFQHLGYTFHLKTYDVFNYPQLLGAAGQPYVNMGIVFPMENTVASLGPNKTKTTVPSMRMNYLSQQGSGAPGHVYNRDWEEWYTGAANGVYTETTDQLQYHMRSHFGMEFFAPNRWVKIINV